MKATEFVKLLQPGWHVFFGPFFYRAVEYSQGYFMTNRKPIIENDHWYIKNSYDPDSECIVLDMFALDLPDEWKSSLITNKDTVERFFSKKVEIHES